MNNLFIPVICFYKHPLPAVQAVFIRSSFILPRAAPKLHIYPSYQKPHPHIYLELSYLLPSFKLFLITG
jgi:hypothetical protein